jgi:hypothetical protein
MPNTQIYGTVTPQTLLSSTTTRAQFPSVACRSVFVQNIDATDSVVIGDVTVTSAKGGKILCVVPPGGGFQFDVGDTNLLGYYVSTANTPKLAMSVFL